MGADQSSPQNGQIEQIQQNVTTAPTNVAVGIIMEQ
ncbi:hypothetical protein PF005_g15889 [Phytophthora fragariae]|uniref:Uncharacterized protein n=1 Tax=Phytophthora fragariae TaxID=53985 RepID=A0A6A3YF39_9STRA|nr:hypothetical protein PF003_g1207 [Phytophthora fragariae]KAE8933471.1 hypothetical protein PF009_g16526 [Phytophthora fragariae]KAE9000234.1 hypothetical protein PF011_g14277 [Phytophthora fragariae]KAE9100112.1 hypothetical protein PF007_g15646 [Phytophthora fragariae]KAE9100627.1 hypothetical protein PF010_g14758 [Phytophthora fragariae]